MFMLFPSQAFIGKRTGYFYLPQHTSRCLHLQPQNTKRAVLASAGPLDLHVGETTISIPLPNDKAQELSAAIQEIMTTFAEKQKAERPKRWESMEYRLNDTGPVEKLEVICNPNAYSTAFEAKVLITLVIVGGVKVVTEGKLSAVKADVETYLKS